VVREQSGTSMRCHELARRRHSSNRPSAIGTTLSQKVTVHPYLSEKITRPIKLSGATKIKIVVAKVQARRPRHYFKSTFGRHWFL